MGGGYAWVTLATNDSYSLGALVLAHSLKQVGTQQQLAILITPGVTNSMRLKLGEFFNVVKEVNILDSNDEANLRLLKRPELGITFTKLHCWRLTQFEKCVFLDADTLVLGNCDELFEREELSAAPDIGWPDCFNSGVFVYRPSNETYEKLIQFALDKGSFDGGDQGLLNSFFSDWALKDIKKHLPFIYNMASTACYSYLPAFKQFGRNAKILHFIGSSKPWLQYFNTETRKVHTSENLKHLEQILQHWWNIFCDLIHPALSSDMAGLAGAFAGLTLGKPRTPEQQALDDYLRRQGWEVGNIDYLGRDSFDNIWTKICETLSEVPSAVTTAEPSEPATSELEQLTPINEVEITDSPKQMKASPLERTEAGLTLTSVDSTIPETPSTLMVESSQSDIVQVQAAKSSKTLQDDKISQAPPTSENIALEISSTIGISETAHVQVQDQKMNESITAPSQSCCVESGSTKRTTETTKILSVTVPTQEEKPKAVQPIIETPQTATSTSENVTASIIPLRNIPEEILQTNKPMEVSSKQTPAIQPLLPSRLISPMLVVDSTEKDSEPSKLTEEPHKKAECPDSSNYFKNSQSITEQIEKQETHTKSVTEPIMIVKTASKLSDKLVTETSKEVPQDTSKDDVAEHSKVISQDPPKCDIADRIKESPKKDSQELPIKTLTDQPKLPSAESAKDTKDLNKDTPNTVTASKELPIEDLKLKGSAKSHIHASKEESTQREADKSPSSTVTEPTPPATPLCSISPLPKTGLQVDTSVPETPPPPVQETPGGPTPPPRKGTGAPRKTVTKKK